MNKRNLLQDATAVIDATGFSELSAEVVEIFYRQATTPELFATKEAVFGAFTAALLRHWHLCGIFALLNLNHGELRECGVLTAKQNDNSQLNHAARLLAERAARSGKECFWQSDTNDESDVLNFDKLDFNATGDAADKNKNSLPNQQATSGLSSTSNLTSASLNDEESREVRDLFAVCDLRVGVAVPVQAHDNLIGVFVALCTTPAQMHQALAGIRFVAAPVIIGLSNVTSASAIHEQQTRIKHLVEDLQGHSAQLEDANKELQRINRYRSMFLARMSHELRTPLASILGFSEILLDQEDLSPTQYRYVEKIQSSGLQQQESLNQLVDLSRLEAGQSELFLHEFSLPRILNAVCESVSRMAKKAEVTVDCANHTDAATIVSDEGKLRQVLYNFLAFAISRSAPQGIVRITAGQANVAQFRITISDDGEPLDDPEHIFETFDAMSKQDERGITLNELGLVIARRLIDVLGGTIKIEELEPRGLRVILDFAPEIFE